METFNRNDHLPYLERILFELAQGKITEKKVRKEYDKNGELMRQTVITTEKLPDYRLLLWLLGKLDPFYEKENNDSTTSTTARRFGVWLRMRYIPYDRHYFSLTI
jgi:hypothetical protein